MIYAAQNESFEATAAVGVAGLVGTIEVAIIDNDGNVVSGPTSLNIIENTVGPTPIGIYTAELVAPGIDGQYSIVWSPDGTWDPISNTVPEDLVVSESGAFVVPQPIITDTAGPWQGPCNAWVPVEEVAECCSAEVGTDFGLLDNAVWAASELLYLLSGNIYSGECSQTVRPCATAHPCGMQVLSRGHIVSWHDGWWNSASRICGCSPLSRVKLAGYPVREIIEVKVNGAVVPDTGYRLDERRWLTRVRNPAEPDLAVTWPSCQVLDLPDTEYGTFSVRYTYGARIPVLGVEAAKQLACQVYLGCIGSDQCQLPQGATRVTRQGITIERQFFGRDPVTQAWRTGLTIVDSFLNAVNPTGLLRRPAFWSPGGERYARRVGS